MIRAGIKGNTAAKRLVVDFLLGIQAREAGEKTDETLHETEAESPEEVVSWDGAKAQLIEGRRRSREE